MSIECSFFVKLSIRQASFHICRKLFPICFFWNNKYVERRLRCLSFSSMICAVLEIVLSCLVSNVSCVTSCHGVCPGCPWSYRPFFLKDCCSSLDSSFPNLADPSLMLVILVRNLVSPTPHKPHLSLSCTSSFCPTHNMCKSRLGHLDFYPSLVRSLLCVSRTDILESCWYSAIALRIATAVLGKESRCVSTPHSVFLRTSHTPCFAVTHDISWRSYSLPTGVFYFHQEFRQRITGIRHNTPEFG